MRLLGYFEHGLSAECTEEEQRVYKKGNASIKSFKFIDTLVDIRVAKYIYIDRIRDRNYN